MGLITRMRQRPPLVTRPPTNASTAPVDRSRPFGLRPTHAQGLLFVAGMATLLGMALGGWMSGWVFDVTGSYHAAFLNGIAWNLLNLCIASWLFWQVRKVKRLGAH